VNSAKWFQEQRRLLPDPNAELAIAMSDTLDTRTRFTIGVEVGWDNEHGIRTALFLDGKFVVLGVDG
jgi:hypothetical protein